MPKIAIIGAGLAGLTLGRLISDRAEVTLFEKSRGVSGRIATRKIHQYEFDHGAQYFTARSRPFQQFLKPLIDDGRVAEWKPKVLTLCPGEKPYKRDWFEPHYVALPGMSALCKSIQGNLDIRLETEVTAIEKIQSPDSPGWQLHTDAGIIADKFDWVISTAPAYQTGLLLGKFLPAEMLHGEHGLDQVQMSPCFSLMLGFKDLPALNFDAAKVKNMGIEWIMLNTSKPGRPSLPGMVVLSTNQWAKTHLDKDKDWITGHMLEELDTILGHTLPEPVVQSLQRWRYANVEQALEPDYLLDLDGKLAAAGDWCLHGRVEGAFLSALSLSQRLEQII